MMGLENRDSVAKVSNLYQVSRQTEKVPLSATVIHSRLCLLPSIQHPAHLHPDLHLHFTIQLAP
jgi:hypothetical protein